MKTNLKYIYLTALVMVCFNCKEEFEIETQDFESVLVVEATITNELKHQEIKLSRTYLLEESTQILENNANVEIIDNQQNTYTFSQNNDGIYVSDIEFQAEPNIAYKLLITTNNGKDYSSNEQLLTPISQIDNLYAELVNDEENGQGVQVFVDSDNSNAEAEYFRYEYEETYKIVAPNTYPFEITFSNYVETASQIGIIVFYDIGFIPKTQEEETCFVSDFNTNIIQTFTSDLTENNVLHMPIRFIPDEEGSGISDISILRDRYSILVKQYVQNTEAYTFYKTISDLGNNESVLSENQPGFVQGNLISLNVNKEKIVGFFEVSSVSKRRIFFNYSEFNMSQPEYYYECDLQDLDYSDNTPPLGDGDANERYILYHLVTRKGYELVEYSEDIYTLARQECVNCTSAGSNIQPDFWED